MQRSFSVLLVLFIGLDGLVASGPQHPQSPIGREVAIPRHLVDGEELNMPLSDLVRFGKTLFDASWTEQDGAGRPLTKGTGKPLSDLNSPLVGPRAFNRMSGPDANSCNGCHNTPYGLSGGAGDFTAGTFVLGQRFDFLTFNQEDKIRTRGALDERMHPDKLENAADFRISPGLFGAGYLELLAREITHDLQSIRDSLKLGESRPLVSKGISFGRIARGAGGLWDTSQVEGLTRISTISNGAHDPPSLVIRPWHQSSNIVSLREFSNTAFNQHHGIQTTERFGVDTDLDGDGFVNEMTRADVTAVSLYQATLQVPGRVIPRDPEIERAVLTGERSFRKLGCAICHVPSLPLTKGNWAFAEPGPYNPPTNLREGETGTVLADLSSDALPQPRIKPDRDGIVHVEAFTDFKVHDISGPEQGYLEPLNQNQTTWSPKFRDGNREFLTKRLWGVANEPPFFHHGLFTTLRQSVLAHSGEALDSRRAFQQSSDDDQDCLIEFLKSLQVLPPGTRNLIVDENFNKRAWPSDASDTFQSSSIRQQRDE